MSSKANFGYCSDMHECVCVCAYIYSIFLSPVFTVQDLVSSPEKTSNRKISEFHITEEKAKISKESWEFIPLRRIESIHINLYRESKIRLIIRLI